MSDILKFKRIFANLPLAEKKLPIVEIGGKFYTWEDIYEEIKKKSRLSKRMLKELKRLGLL
ncbi:MAG: hypothetical protein ACP5H3_00765 [Candidatus Aenigmatarchaeota archaeon]|jgi:hypothetical protein